MTLNIFKAEQFLNYPLEKVFDFFKKPENLDSVTPQNLGFKILTPGPIPMEKGTVIDYTIRLYCFPMKWQTVITDYNPPYSFTDSQVKGPYQTWTHSHQFTAQEGGTLMTDEVHYSVPFGPIGEIAHILFVKRQIKRIFDYRKKVIEEIFKRSV